MNYLRLSALLSVCMCIAACGGNDGSGAPPVEETTLAVSLIGRGTGTVTSFPAGIDCGNDCTETYDISGTVMLTATADIGSTFTGWTGACGGTGPCEIEMDQSHTVTATFQPNDLENAIRAKALSDRLENFALAAENGMNRAAGSAGYDASVSHVTAELAKTDFTVTEQDVVFRHFAETGNPVLERTAPTARTYAPNDDFITFTYSGSGNVTAEIAFLNPMIPPGVNANDSDDGCNQAGFANVSGKIAVIQRGTCEFREKALNAQKSGAAAVLIFNEGQAGRAMPIGGNLGEDSAVTIPVAGIGYEVAQGLYELSQAGAVTVRIEIQTTDESRTAKNIIAETPYGNADQVIMLGARLDSSPNSPGINDNATGAAALLEIAAQISEIGFDHLNAIRFAWWMGRDGLAGAIHYTENLSEAEAAKIGMYLSADPIGSPNYVIGVYDTDVSETGNDPVSITGDPNDFPVYSDEIEAAFVAYFQAHGVIPVPMPVSGDTDYYPFIFIDVPFGGLFTGTDGIKTTAQAAVFGGNAGEPYDICNGLDCDDMSNVDSDAFLQNTKALANVLTRFANRTTLFTGRAKRVGDMLPVFGEVSVRHGKRHNDRHLRPVE